jgi:hypothetical protein
MQKLRAGKSKFMHKHNSYTKQKQHSQACINKMKEMKFKQLSWGPTKEALPIVADNLIHYQPS